MNVIIQLKITLKETKPPIWRRLLIENTITFETLHHVIQIAMGWENYHLYEFIINEHNRITEITPEIIDDELLEGAVDSSGIELCEITDKQNKFEYVYDFGDSWEHEILVEKHLPRDSQIPYPVCTGGKLNCPPEDCGGISGFYTMLDIINQKKHPEKEEYLEWLGGKYDPEYFDMDQINQNLYLLD